MLIRKLIPLLGRNEYFPPFLNVSRTLPVAWLKVASTSVRSGGTWVPSARGTTWTSPARNTTWTLSSRSKTWTPTAR